jgi:hypothetical protein
MEDAFSMKGEMTMFKRNEGTLDRILRVAVAMVLLPTGLFLLGGLRATVPGLISTILGTLALITGLTGVCPLYIPFGFSTLEKENALMDQCASMAADCRGGAAGAGRMCRPGSRSIRNAPAQQE